MKDYIGRYVKRFESGNKESYCCVQSGLDDGITCGSYQFVNAYGIVINFLKEVVPDLAKDLYWNGPTQMVNYWPGEWYSSNPDQIKNVWIKAIECFGEDKFFDLEHKKIKKDYYIPCGERIKNSIGININDVSRAYQELTWSGAVHFGEQTFADMFIKVVKEVGNFASNQDKVFDRIYELRYTKMKEAYSSPGNRYLPGFFDGSSEVETLRPYLIVKPIEESEEKEMKKVMIDPGHYGSYYNQSPCNTKYYESNFTWDLALKLGAYLKQFGLDATLTRDKKDNNPGLVDRGKMAAGYDLFISIHSNGVAANAMAKKEEIDYPVAYCMVEDNRFSFDEISHEVGLKLAQGVQEVLQTKQKAEVYLWRADWDRDGNGMLDDNYLGVLHGARLAGVPGVVLEHSFHTNTVITNKLLQESYVDALAKKDAEIIADFFGVYKKPNIKMTSFSLIDSTVTVLADNLPIYKDASMYNQIGTLKKNDKWRAVQSYRLSDNRKGLRLETGYYINAVQGVNVIKNKIPSFVGVTNSPDNILNVRDFPNSNGGSVLYQLYNGNLFDVIGECYNNGDHWHLIHIKNKNVDIKGFVAARYVK